MFRTVKIAMLALATLITFAGWKGLNTLLKSTPETMVARVQGETLMVKNLETKYDHGTGWPSFTSPISDDSIEYREDSSFVNDKDFSYPRGKDISHKRGKDISHPCGKQISHPPWE